MSRDALVVGINNYEKLGKDLINLTAPAKDAEAIAKLLEDYGEFKVKRLPEVKNTENGKIRIGEKTSVKTTQLEEAIIQLFTPKGKPPETALLYFSGHGLRKDRGIQEGYLAASDVKPTEGIWGISLQWLRRLLQESQVRQQIIILDCCYSGEVLNFAEADPGDRGKKGDRCFIAACRDFETAYQAIDGKHSVLTQMLLKGLEPDFKGWVTNLSLAHFLNQEAHVFPQTPLYYNSGEVIKFTRRYTAPIEEVAARSKDAVCPYKGLEYFDCKEEDAKFFHGRTNLTDKLREKLLKDKFLTVLGASGSGKSSVVRAGLLYQLESGWKSLGTNNWQYKKFLPGEKPLENLALAFVETELSDIDKGIQLGRAKEELITKGKFALESLIIAIQKPIVLVVDQFEEVFTLCPNEEERKQFFDCLLGALELLGNKFYLVITMRADFLGKCTEYRSLAQKIQAYQEIVLPMEPEELEQAITKPAEQVGLKIEPELVKQMMADVLKSPGMLPLLQYTLSELWKHRESECLTLQAYTKLDGIHGALPKRANEIYDEFSPTQQGVTRKIFLELTQLGEGTEDTRRRVRKQDLLNCHSDPQVVEEIIQKLASEKGRLLVTNAMLEKGNTSKPVEELVDVAHEALIRHWDLLREWLSQSREDIRKKRKFEAEAKDWLAKDRNQDYLLRGLKLREAEGLLQQMQKTSDSFFLNQDTQEFVQQSLQREKEEQEIAERIKQEQIRKEKEEQARKQKEIQEELQREQEKLRKQKQRLLRNRIILGITVPILLGTLAWIWNNNQNNEIVRLAQNSNRLSDSYKGSDALVEGIKAAKALKNPFVIIKSNTRTQVITALARSIYDLKEINNLEGHRSAIKNVSFSLDSKTLASGDVDGVIKLWKSDGTLLRTIHGHTRYINSISFHPDGKMFASASADGTVKLWNLENGTLIKTFLGHTKIVNKVIFSPDKNYLVSASDDGFIKVWSFDGRLIRNIKLDSSVKDITFSPDGQTLASSETNGGRDKSKDGIVKLWNWNTADGKPSKTISTAQCNSKRCTIWAVKFSPDGKFIATASDNRTIKLWKTDGTFIGYIDGIEKDDGGHNDQILALSFRPNKTQAGEYLLASASRDQSVRVWYVKSNYDIEPPKREELKPKVLELAGYDSKVSSVEFSADGNTLASGSNDKTVKLWNIDSRLQELPHEREKVKSVSFSPDGKIIASSGQSEINNKGIIHLWNWDENSKRWQEKQSISAHELLIRQVRFSPDGQVFASVSMDGTIKIWSKEGQFIASSPSIKKEFYSISFSPDRKTLASGDANNNVILWEYKGNSLTPMQTLAGHTNGVRSVSFSSDGKWLASADIDNVIKLWRRDGNSWKWQKDLKGHRDDIQAITFSPDSQILASASDDATVKLWNLNGNLINTLYGHTRRVTGISFTPDSQIIASVSADKKIIFWGRNGNLLHTVNKHDGVISDVQFSPDGQTLASASDDYRVILWDLHLDQLLAQGCNLSGNYLRTSSSITSEIRSFCRIPEVEPELLVEQGKDLARQGKIEDALTKFKEAQQRGYTLNFDPNKEANNLAEAAEQLEQGLEDAKQGKIQEAANAFKLAIELDSAFANSGIEPAEEAKRLYEINL
ncbi:peptidase C14, caspase catalytic subunit p20 [Nostoc sp. NIES-3756]|uniref:nSTAND1 domain-containing NTPase n=1 Tax=Nostoc sp. NIES-3756 TaxID=1751286 RepID=UPI000722EA44|nr:caspase family protein [Nostoc sp. NIES-3756]BAT53429.1 peptidase C14, caspase catalytic subunit p20 [Nostoc sp. NIES-3756]